MSPANVVFSQPESLFPSVLLCHWSTTRHPGILFGCYAGFFIAGPSSSFGDLQLLRVHAASYSTLALLFRLKLLHSPSPPSGRGRTGGQRLERHVGEVVPVADIMSGTPDEAGPHAARPVRQDAANP